jgi:ribonuclease R
MKLFTFPATMNDWSDGSKLNLKGVIMAKHYSKKDPHAEREAQKYERPIASRELIMAYLEEVGKPTSLKEIIIALDMDDEEQQIALKRRLRAMERDGQVMRTRGKKFGLVVPMELIRGRVIGRKDGYGFVVPELGGDDIFLSPYQMRAVFPDDIVLVRAVGTDRRGRPEGTIVEIIQRNTHQIVGRLFHEEGVDFVVPERKNINQDVLITENSKIKAQTGHYVVVNITTQPTQRRQPVGEITEILGERRAPGMETEVAIRSHGLRYLWSAEIDQDVRKIPSLVQEGELVGRKDLRALPFVTIDGVDAKDFDDAVYCEPHKDGGWTLYVAIADVSHYVQPNSSLDQEAALRGNSVYFPSRVIPMLPEALSNEICSLKPQVDRLVMVCQMRISKEGQLEHHEFYEGVIYSHARLTYAEVARMLEHPKTNQHALLVHLQHLHELYKKLYRQRTIRGALNFETTETRIIFDEHDKIREIVPVERNDAHKIIEECMLIANVATARFLQHHHMPVLYRVHEGPTNERLEKLHDFLRGVGLRLPGGDAPTSKDYAKLLERLQNRPDAHLIQTVLLRSLQQAIYTPSNKGHFGLAYDAYCHFTSPIRRYPDLLVHRAIRHVLSKQPAEKFNYNNTQITELGKTCSKTERSADLATRDVVDWLKCHYMLEKVGNSYEGIIVDITSFGAFVELKNVYVQGLIHITALENDYYLYDAPHHRLVGQRSGMQYRLGDPIFVQVARVDVDERQIDFVLAQK